MVHSLDGDVAGHAWLDVLVERRGGGVHGGWLSRVVLVRLDDGVPVWCGHGDWARPFMAA